MEGKKNVARLPKVESALAPGASGAFLGWWLLQVGQNRGDPSVSSLIITTLQ